MGRCRTALGRWLMRMAWQDRGHRWAHRLLQCFGTTPHSHLLCFPKERQTMLKPLWFLPPAVLETGAQGSCGLPAVCRLLLHPALPSPRLSGAKCGLPGHKHVCGCANIHLFVCIHEKTTQKPALAHAARDGFREKLCAFICLWFSLCKSSCTGEAELSMEQFAWRSLVQNKKEQSSTRNFLCSAFYWS